MKEYELSANEVILFKGMVAIVSDWKNEKNVTEYKTQLMLTNFNVVLITEVKKLFSRILDKKIYSIKDIKVYDETVQVVRRKNLVDVYLATGELFLKFGKEKNAKEFCDKAVKLKDGNSKFVRSVKKTQKAIKETNEALNIDMVEIAKGTAAFACEVVSTVGGMKGASTVTKGFAGVANLIGGKLKKSKEQKTLNAAPSDLEESDEDTE